MTNTNPTCPACGWTICPPAACGNPDCSEGDAKRRPNFRPPMRTQRGHGASGRVRMYRGPDDTSIEDVDEQGPMGAYMDRYVDGWRSMTPRQRASVEAEWARFLRENGVTAAQIRSWVDDGSGAGEVTIVGSMAQQEQRLSAEVARRVKAEMLRRLNKAARNM